MTGRGTGVGEQYQFLPSKGSFDGRNDAWRKCALGWQNLVEFFPQSDEQLEEDHLWDERTGWKTPNDVRLALLEQCEDSCDRLTEYIDFILTLE